MGIITWLKKVYILTLTNVKRKIRAGLKRKALLVAKPTKKCKKASPTVKKTKRKRKKRSK